MRLSRCFIDAPLALGARLPAGEAISAHLLRVLRLGVGDRCVLFNGDGHDYLADIVEIGKRDCQLQLREARTLANESPLQLQLQQGIARGEKMDLVLQKATELGVATIAPVISERTEVRLDGERGSKRHAHWLGVLRAACEQSGRARVPALAEARELGRALAELQTDVALALDPEGELRLADLALPADARVALLVGPEGGLSPRDLQAARAAGFRGLRLGPRVLRTETAGLAAIAALQARFGDLSG